MARPEGAGRWASVLLVALALAACSGSSGSSDAGTDDGGPAPCASGLRQVGSSCVPIFDDCKDDEIPLLGGGCKRVGVLECDAPGPGIKGPPDWTCKPIGPPRACLEGWRKVGGGWCEPRLPPAPCPEGTMEVLGRTECQPVGECGTGTWGAIAIGPRTLHVDRAFAGEISDGSAAMPFKTIAAAVAVATEGAQIAIAAGRYREALVVDRPLTLEGRCPQLVTLQPLRSTMQAALRLTAKGATVRGLTVTGARRGIELGAGAVATLERVVVRGSGAEGVVVEKAELLLRDALIEKNRIAGLKLVEARGTVERSVLKENLPPVLPAAAPLWGDWGVGLYAHTKSTIALRDTLVASNGFAGVIVEASSEAVIERSVVRETRPLLSDHPEGGRGGGGLHLQPD